MCSSTWMLSSRLNSGSHFPGLSGKSCKGAAMLTAPRVDHGLCAIIGRTIGGIVETGEIWIEVVGIDDFEIDEDWVEDVCGDDDWRDDD